MLYGIWKQYRQLRANVLTCGAALWLAGFWVLEGWQQQIGLWCLLPLLIFNGDHLLTVVRQSRWLWLLALLLIFQSLSCLWTADRVTPSGRLDEGIVLFVLIAGLVFVAKNGDAGFKIIAALSVLAAVIAAISLILFYSDPERSLAFDRLRNPLVYGGLHPVVTGLLFAFGAVGAAWFACRSDWSARLKCWLPVLMILVFGLMATQSRGAILLFTVGSAVLIGFDWRGSWPILVAAAVAVAAYFGSLALMGATDSAVHLIERGASGRFGFYQWFLNRMNGPDYLVGKGLGSPIFIPKEELNWFAHHPHSVYLTQFYLTGAVGLSLLLGLLGWVGRLAFREARKGHVLWLALLAGGVAGTLFDGAHVFSIYAEVRIEFLLVAVPAALAAGRFLAARELVSPAQLAR